MINDIQVSKNFKLREFQCKDGNNQVKLDSVLLNKLQKFRDRLGVPLTINSAYRTPEYNKKIGGSPNSQHMLGAAVDVSIRNINMKIESIAKIAEEIGFTGIGLYDTFIHLDVRPNKTKFDYRTKK